MRKAIVWAGMAVVPIDAFFVWKLAFSAPTAVPPLADIERMTDTRDPKKISGSFWTKNLDCTYKNPSQEWIVWALSFDCKRAEHNLEVLRTKRDYFTPRSTASDDPPYCLVPGPASSQALAAAEKRKRLYCRK